MKTLLKWFLVFSHLSAVAISQAAIKQPDAESSVRAEVKQASGGFFEVVSYKETERRTQDNLCGVRFEITAELQRDALSPIGFGGRLLKLKLAGLLEVSVLETGKPGGPFGEGFQLWRKGSRLVLSGSRTYGKFDEGWKEDGVNFGLYPKNDDKNPFEVVGKLPAADSQSSVSPVQGFVVASSASATQNKDTAVLPDSAAFEASLTEFAARHLKGLQQARGAKVALEGKMTVNPDGSARATAKVDYLMEFKQATVFMSRHGFFTAPVVGEVCPAGTRQEFEQILYWDAGQSLPYSATVLLVKSAASSPWVLTVQSVTGPQRPQSDWGIRLRYQERAGQFYVTEAAVVRR